MKLKYVIHSENRFYFNGSYRYLSDWIGNAKSFYTIESAQREIDNMTVHPLYRGTFKDVEFQIQRRDKAELYVAMIEAMES